MKTRLIFFPRWEIFFSVQEKKTSLTKEKFAYQKGIFEKILAKRLKKTRKKFAGSK